MYFLLFGAGSAVLLFLSWILIEPKKEELSVKNQLVVITGGTSGLGLEIAIECLKRDASVILLARKLLNVKSHDRLKHFEDRVKSISCDVTKREDLFRARIRFLDHKSFVSILYSSDHMGGLMM